MFSFAKMNRGNWTYVVKLVDPFQLTKRSERSEAPTFQQGLRPIGSYVGLTPSARSLH